MHYKISKKRREYVCAHRKLFQGALEGLVAHQKNSEKDHNNVHRLPGTEVSVVVTAYIIALVTVGRAEPVSRAGSWRGSPGGRPPPSQPGWRGGQLSGAEQRCPPAASGRSPGTHSGARVKLKTEEWEGNHLGSSQDEPRSPSCLRGGASIGPVLQLPLGIGDAPCGHSILGWPKRRELHLSLWFPSSSLCHPRSLSPLLRR